MSTDDSIKLDTTKLGDQNEGIADDEYTDVIEEKIDIDLSRPNTNSSSKVVQDL